MADSSITTALEVATLNEASGSGTGAEASGSSGAEASGSSGAAPQPDTSALPYDPIDIDSAPRIKLVSYDGMEFDVARAIVCGTGKDGKPIGIACQFVRDMQGEEAPEGGEEERVVLSRCSGKTLAEIVKFINFHAKEPMEEIKRPLELQYKDSFVFDDSISLYDREFINCDMEQLLRVTEAANYLNISDLTSLMHAKIMSLIKNRSKTEIQDMFRPYMHLVVEGQ